MEGYGDDSYAGFNNADHTVTYPMVERMPCNPRRQIPSNVIRNPGVLRPSPYDRRFPASGLTPTQGQQVEPRPLRSPQVVEFSSRLPSGYVKLGSGSAQHQSPNSINMESTILTPIILEATKQEEPDDIDLHGELDTTRYRKQRKSKPKGVEYDMLKHVAGKEIMESLVNSVAALDYTMQAHRTEVLTMIGASASTPDPSVTSVSSYKGKTMRAPVGPIKKTDKVEVSIRMVFLKLGEIDTVRENFQADVYIEAQWKEPALNKCSEEDFENFNPENFWNPKLLISNNVGDLKESVWHTLAHDRDGNAILQEKRRAKGVFLEFMELNKFPFDTQDLSVSVTSDRGENELYFIEDPKEVSSVNVGGFVDEQEWNLHEHVVNTLKLETPKFKNSRHKKPSFTCSCRATRRSGFFVWNIILVMFSICSLAFATFTVDVSLPQNRLQLSFTLVLTTIAFKFVANQGVPKISYLTYLDKYILTSMSILCSICVWHAIILQIFNTDDDTDTAEYADKIALGVLGGIYILFHIVYFVTVFILTYRNRSQENKKGLEHKAKLSQSETPNPYGSRVGPM